MVSDSKQPLLHVVMLGSFPPQCQGVHDYCAGLVPPLSALCRVTGIGFKRMYPGALFPGVKSAMDATNTPLVGEHLEVKHPLTWYNPFGWLYTALFTPGDVFHLQWWSLPLFPIAFCFVVLMKLRAKPVVVTVHNVLPHEGGRFFVFSGRTLCQLADKVIVHSDVNAEQIVDAYGLQKDKVYNVHLGVRTDNMPSDAPPESQAEARSALNLPVDADIALLFGTIRPYKGVRTTLEALTLLAEKNPSLHLVIAGVAWEPWEPYQAIIDEAGLTDRVHLLLDYIPEDQTPTLFSAADIALLPYTHFDAQSGVGAQVLRHATPLIVSSVGGLPEWVDHQESWTVQPNDPEELATALNNFFTDTDGRTEAFASIAHDVLARYSCSRAATLHAEIYQAICSQPPTNA